MKEIKIPTLKDINKICEERIDSMRKEFEYQHNLLLNKILKLEEEIKLK